MDKYIVIYIILIAISISIFFIIVNNKCNILKKEKENLKSNKEMSDCMTFLFDQILKK